MDSIFLMNLVTHDPFPKWHMVDSSSLEVKIYIVNIFSESNKVGKQYCDNKANNSW